MVGGLIAFWIKSPKRNAPLGFGVTARSLDDALRIIRHLGYGGFLPEDESSLTITEGISVSELDQNHIVPNMGPIVVRGMWYPFVTLGVPN